MMGIAGLPQGSNMPAPGQAMPMGMGQPPMPGMKPPAGGTPAGVAALTPSLAQMNKQQLLMEFMNPGSRIPKYALISAIDEKAKQEKAMAAVQGSLAQQQAQQQPGTVAQEVLQSAMQPVMARHGGAMHSYRQGGIVGYQSGGATSYPVEEQEDITTLPLNERIRRTLARLRRDAQGTDERSVNERIRAALPDVSLLESRRKSEEGPRQWQQAAQGEEPDLMGESLIPLTEPDIGQAPNVAMLGKTGDADIDIGPAQSRVVPPTPPKPAPQAAPQVRPPAGIAASKPDDLEAAYRRRMETEGVTPAQQKAFDEYRKAELEARQAALMGQDKRAKEMLDRAKARYENTVGGLGGLTSQRGLLALVGSITPEKGKIFGSLARGASGFLEREDAVRREAASAYELAQAAYDKELTLMDGVRVAIAERNTAIAKGDMDAARAAEQKRAELQIKLVEARQERQDKQRDIALAEERNRIAREGVEVQRTSATRPPAEIQLMEWLRSPENKKLYDSIQSAKRSEERLLKLRELYDKRPITAGEMSFEDFIIEFEKATGKASSTAGGPPPGAVRLKGQQ